MTIILDISDDSASTIVQSACVALGLTPNDDEHARTLVGGSLRDTLARLAIQGDAIRKSNDAQAEIKKTAEDKIKVG